MQSSIIDTHCHLNMVEEKGIPAGEALKSASEAGVNGAVLIAVDETTARHHAQLCETHSAGPVKLYWTAGLHPEGAHDISGNDTLFDFVRQSRSRSDFLGIGETGLDYYHSTEFTGNQKQSFLDHLRLSADLSVPIVVHLRDSQMFVPGKIQSVLDAEKLVSDTGATGVLHCFTYGYDEAMRFVDRGWFISFSGILTYKNASVIQDAAVRIPLDCILVETDAPFLTPNPVRGQTNQPAFTAHTARFLANLRAEKLGENPVDVLSHIYSNTQRFFALKK